MNSRATNVISALTYAFLCLLLRSPLHAQEVATSTPVRISIPTDSVPALLVVASPTATRTPTPSVVVLEAKAEAGPINVRAEASIEADRLGTIQAGEYYPVLGRSYRWLQIQFPSAPQGRAWVFEELVTLFGDEGSIPNLQLVTPVVLSQAQADATLTQAAFTKTPGAVLTLTARSRILPVPGQETALPGAEALFGETSSLLPTYTYPPDLLAPTLDQGGTTNINTPATTGVQPASSSGIPPAVPIALLAAGGLLGLLLNSLRRR